MEFLKEILGEALFDQITEKINAHNGNEANKGKKIKLANLESGEYVGKAKHDALQALLDGTKTELTTANTLIADLKKGTKGNEELQGKITGYETQVADLQKQLAETKLNSAVKVALLSEKAVDVGYMSYKISEMMKEQGKALELDENENIKGWDDVIASLKTQFPAHFEGSIKPKVEPNRLPDQQQQGLTRAEILKKPYAERMKIYDENPDAYKEAMKS